MENYAKGKVLTVHCYKHNGKIHRTWDKTTILDETNDYLVCGNNKVKITEATGRTHRTKETAIVFFYKKRWFNIIAQLKSNGIFYYCNIASPYVIDCDVLKYIDYDLDLKVFPDYKYKILDEEEYRQHKAQMNYDEKMDSILYQQLDILINMTMNMSGPFRPGFAEHWYQVYQQHIHK